MAEVASTRQYMTVDCEVARIIIQWVLHQSVLVSPHYI